MVTPKFRNYVSENIGNGNGMGIISETKFGNENGRVKDESDWFLKGFLVGYRREKDRMHRLRIEQEERVKRELEMRKEEKKWKSEVREMIKKEVTTKCECLI